MRVDRQARVACHGRLRLAASSSAANAAASSSSAANAAAASHHDAWCTAVEELGHLGAGDAQLLRLPADREI